MSAESWEKEFDEKYCPDCDRVCQESPTEGHLDYCFIGELKSFIRSLVSQERRRAVEEYDKALAIEGMCKLVDNPPMYAEGVSNCVKERKEYLSKLGEREGKR